MKKYVTLFFILFTFCSFSQDVSYINKNLKLPDSLIFENEVRIYKWFGNTNYTSILRIYQEKTNKWKAEFYQYWTMIDNDNGFEIEKHDLKANNEIEFIYLNLVLNNVFDLPDMSDIRWKMKGKGEIKKVLRTVNSKGDKKTSYEMTIPLPPSLLDGSSYKVQVKNNYEGSNEFHFSDPEFYLKRYPEVDELTFYSEIIKLIKKEFNIWEEE